MASVEDMFGELAAERRIHTSVLAAFAIVALVLGAAMAAAQSLRSNLFRLSAFDPLSYIAVVAILGMAAVVAVSVPAWRATRVDPAGALLCQ